MTVLFHPHGQFSLFETMVSNLNDYNSLSRGSRVLDLIDSPYSILSFVTKGHEISFEKVTAV